MVFPIIQRIASERRNRARLDLEDILRAERLLGRPLPPLLRELYLTCGNGGFGVEARPLILDDDDASPKDPRDRFVWAVANNVSLVRRAIVSREATDEYRWPDGLVNFREWGCGLESCVDLDDARLRVVRFDPHFATLDEFEENEAEPLSPDSQRIIVYPEAIVGREQIACFQLESNSLEEWLEVCLEGHSAATLQGMGPQRKRWEWS